MASSATNSPFFPNRSIFQNSELTDDDLTRIGNMFDTQIHDNSEDKPVTMDLGWNMLAFAQPAKFFANLDKYKIVALDLENNSIGTAGIKNIAEFLKNNKTIIGINLSSNETIHSRDVIPLFDSLKSNTTLKALHLRNTSIDDTAIQALEKLIKNNKTLEELDLSWTCITEEGKSKIEKLASKTKLKVVCQLKDTSKAVGIVSPRDDEYLDAKSEEESNI